MGQGVSAGAWAYEYKNVYGIRSIFSGSWKRKMVYHSSTESEIIGMYDVLPQVLWTKKFGGSRIYNERDSLVPR